MGVKYNINYSGTGVKACVSAICFGWMNNEYFPVYACANRNDLTQESIDQISRNQWKHASVRFYPVIEVGIWNQYNLDFWSSMTKLIQEIPWLSTIVKLRPNAPEPCIDVLTGNNPADKVILALMFMRNMAQEMSFIRAYCEAIANGCSHAQAFVVSGFYSVTIGGLRNQKVYSRRSFGEYNHFKPQTFGRESLSLLLSPDWFQPSWQEQGGYRRAEQLDHRDAVRLSDGSRGRMSVFRAFEKDNNPLMFDHDHIQQGTHNLDADGAVHSKEAFEAACQQIINLWP